MPKDLVVGLFKLRRGCRKDIQAGFCIAIVPGHEHAAIVTNFGRLVHGFEEAGADRDIARGDGILLARRKSEPGEEEGDNGLADGNSLPGRA